MVSTSRCGRENPGSNPGHDRVRALYGKRGVLCPVYNSRRTILFEEVELKHVHFHTLSLSDKFIFVMKHCQIEVSKFINEAWSIRQTKL